MHPSELKNQALVAAAKAERDGFAATAEALKALACGCAAEARDLLLSPQRDILQTKDDSAQDRIFFLSMIY